MAFRLQAARLFLLVVSFYATLLSFSFAQAQTQNLVCPTVRTSALTQLNCKSPAHNCNSDKECPDGEKCCPLGSQCELLCRKAVKQERCAAAIDLAILLDASEAISPQEWSKLLKFTADLMDYYGISEDGTRISVATFSTDVDIVLSFNEFSGVEMNAASVKRGILGAKQSRGPGLRIDKALKAADKDLFNRRFGMREDQKKVCLLVTSGAQTKDQGPSTQLGTVTALLSARGVDIYAVGVGDGVDSSELRNIASTEDFIYTASSFEEINKVLEPFGTVQCSGCKKPLDLVLGIPTSRTLGDDFKQIKLFFVNLIALFDISPSKTHVGVITFSESAQMSLHMDKMYEPRTVTRFINDITPTGDQMRIDRAIDTAGDYGFTIYGGVRQTMPKTFVLFAPTNSSSSAAANMKAAEKLKSLGVRLLIVGLTADINKVDFSSVVSQPSRKFLFSSAAYDGFTSVRHDMASTLCNVRYGDMCPSPAKSPSCPMFVVNECESDGDCNEARLKCCLRGCAKKCVPKVKTCFVPIDVAFIMDNSESVSSEKYDFVKRFVKDVIMSYADAENSANFAIGQYAKYFQTGTKRFRNFRSMEELDEVINSLRQMSSSAERNVGAGLRGAANEFFQVKNGMRQGLPRFLIVLASANPSASSEAIESAVVNLDKENVRRIAVGFTEDATPGFLRMLASDPSLMFRVDEPKKLDKVMMELTPMLCQEKPGRCPPSKLQTANQCSRVPIPPQSLPCGDSARKPGRLQKENDWDCPGEQKCCLHSDGCHFVCAEPPVSCKKSMEILFLVESTKFVGEHGFNRVKHFITRLVENFDVSGTTITLAMATYADSAQPVVQFSDSAAWRKAEFQKAVQGALFLGEGRVRTAEALKFADRRIFTSRFGSREDIKKTIVLIGSGRYNELGPPSTLLSYRQ
ncbi:collagen alpha-6(VI) chain isoform X2 [Nematostella vectensis]|uniref:collagen alpha-6(VI) chain isoform X2 n=1 Tax=Nematostella vectensis TaxID=45351 RepID=UPI00139066DB|nr:collagen alpha-6(VI) chain isoform X2 [Nematostella vectensis]